MSRRRTILIADPDPITLGGLGSALESSYEVLVARDGSRALELAVLSYPDLIFFHRSCPLIGATQFSRILRANPRTEAIPLVVLSDEPVVARSVPGFLEGVLVKPLNLDEVRAHVAAVFRRVDAAGEVSRDDSTVSGDLTQISMIDLLQVFAMNRRSGALQLSQPGGPSGEVFLHEGSVQDAVVGNARGEKALFRLLSWGAGHFTFAPARRASAVTIDRHTDSLIMEGLRQEDELGRLRGELPPDGASVERTCGDDELPTGLQPVTAELLDLTDRFPRVGDLVERVAATDLEVFQALQAVLQAGLVRVVVEGAGPQRPVLTGDEVLELRARLRRAGLPPTYQAAPKLAVVAPNLDDLRALVRALERLPEFRAADLAHLAQAPLGPLGVLELEQGFCVELYGFAWDERLLPLAVAISAGTVAALVVGTNDLSRVAAALRLLEEDRRASLMFVRRPREPQVPAGKRRRVVEVGRLGDDEVRAVLLAALKHAASADLRGVTL